MTRLTFVVSLWCFALFCEAQDVSPLQDEGRGAALRVVSWNVENLFDCNDDSLKNDAQFLPEGEYRWTRGRYWRKLDNVARTLTALSDGERWPALVGLCEVENDTVLFDLTRRSPLRAARYDYVMTDSPDERGVDVALLFQPSVFRILRYEGIRVPSEEHGLKPTRDILHVVGIVGESDEIINHKSTNHKSPDTLHVLVVHLPSRASGTRAAGRNRQLAAQVLANVVDSLQAGNVVLLGDFNAEPGDKVFDGLTPPLRSLVPRKRSEQLRIGGSYYFQQRWCFLDHILLSERLWQQSRKRVEVARFPFLLTKDGIPFRTFRGPAYQGGISDHLPLWTEIRTGQK